MLRGWVAVVVLVRILFNILYSNSTGARVQGTQLATKRLEKDETRHKQGYKTHNSPQIQTSMILSEGAEGR